MLRVLFTGYAPVHFLCFLPFLDRLRETCRVSITLSGGLRRKGEQARWHYDLAGMYDAFDTRGCDRVAVEDLSSQMFDVVIGGNTKLILPGQYGASIQIFHGVSFRNKAVRTDNAAWDHYFMVGPYMRRRFASMGVIEAHDVRAVDVGFMKTDALLSEAHHDRVRERFAFDSRPLLVYAPTGQIGNSLERMGEDVLRELSRSEKYNVIVKPHDHPKNPIDWFARLRPFESSSIRVTRELDVVPLLGAADLLITDASSVASEYSLLDRPMVFLDVPELLAAATGVAGSAVDLETWGRKAGDLVCEPRELVPVIENALASPNRHQSLRQAMAADLFFNPGKATEAGHQWFCSRFGL